MVHTVHCKTNEGKEQKGLEMLCQKHSLNRHISWHYSTNIFSPPVWYFLTHSFAADNFRLLLYAKVNNIDKCTYLS